MPYPEVLVRRWRSVMARRAWHGVVELSRRTAQHLTVSQLRQPVRQTLVELEAPCLHKTQRGDRRNHLGHGLDPHDRILGHRTATDRRHACGDHLDVPSTQQRDPARNCARVNVTNQQLPQRCAHLGDRATLDREDQTAARDRSRPMSVPLCPPRPIGYRRANGEGRTALPCSRAAVQPCSRAAVQPSRTLHQTRERAE